MWSVAPSPPPIEGGKVSTVEGSGDVTVNPAVAAVGTPRTFTVTYTALTDLEDAVLQIEPKGTVITDDAATTATEELSTSSTAYGYVRAASSRDASKGDLSVSGTTVQWDNLNLMTGESVVTVIGPINVMSWAQKYPWKVSLSTDATVGASDEIMDVNSETDGSQTLDFYATQAASNGVTFRIKDPMDYPAGSRQTIEFQFTANATPIRDGYVRVQLPSLWMPPNPALKDGKSDSTVTSDAAAKVSVGITKAATTSTSALEKNALSIGGNTITVHVDTLEQADTVTITYGVGTDKDGEADSKLQAMIQSTQQDGVKIYGFSKASPDTSQIRQEIAVNVTNAQDGSGSATILADPGLRYYPSG